MKYRNGLIGCSALVSSLIAMPALAQTNQQADPTVAETDQHSGALDEIIVTAQKKDENLQKMPLSVQAISGDSLARANITDQSQLQTVVPGLRLDKFGAFSNTYVRGIGQGFGQSFANNKIATNLDGVYLTRWLVASSYAYDMERVEVVKGPQGTLYGRNATGGSINYITRRPGDDFEGTASVQFGNYDSRLMAGAINVPVTEQLKVRASFQTQLHDGYLSNGGNDEDTFGARLRVLYDPTDNFSVLLTANYYKSEHKFVSSVPLRADGSYYRRGDPWYYPVNLEGFNSKYDSRMVYGEIGWDITDSVTLTWVPSYSESDWDWSTPLSGAAIQNDLDTRQHTEELRLNGETGRLSWVAGAYYYNGTNYNNTGFFVPVGPGFYILSGGPGPGNGQDFIKEKSWAAFAQGTYSLTDALRVTGGVRSSWDEKSGVQTRGSQPHTGTLGPFNVTPVGPYTVNNQTVATIKDENIDWRVGLEFDVARSSMLYGSVSTGYLQGGFTNGTIADPINFFGPENVTAYEIGSKNRFFDNRLQVNAAAFYYDYRDLQVQVVDATAAATYVNAPKTEIYGGELEIEFVPTAADRFELRASVLHTEITEFQIAGRNYAGQELQQSPKYTIIAAYEHTFDLANGASLTPRIDGTFVGKQWSAFERTPGSRQPASALLNANVRYEAPKGSWTVMAFVNNITKEDVRGGGTPGWFGADPEGIGFVFGAVGLTAPRTYGVRLDVDF